jgi:choline-sulfatase
MATERPNIVFIFTDQQSYRMMSCAGNGDLNTPAMDSIAAYGVRFDRAYCTNPVCVPSRFSLLTGRMPSEIGQRKNSSRELDPIPQHIKERGMGWLMRQAGYETAYGGKVHLPKGMKPEELGFDVISTDQRDQLAEDCVDFLRRDHDDPFLLVASFINPHDICYMGIRDFATSDFDHALVRNGETELACLDEALQRPEGVGDEEFFAEYAPPLPPNFAIQEDEPEAIRMLLKRREFRWRERTEWSEQRWREHRWAYCRLTERVDRQIGRVLDAVRENMNGDTVIIFSSDHGDHDSSHHMEHKTAFYDEASRIPFLISQPGVTAAGAVDSHLVSNGLDLIPTLCDYAGVEPPEDLAGRSLRPLAEGRQPGRWRRYVPVENEIGLAVFTERYKYELHEEGENAEQLIDLQADPHETRNAAGDEDQRDALAEHRELFEEHYGRRV